MHRSDREATRIAKATRTNFITVTAKSAVPDRDVFKMRFKAGGAWENRLRAIKRYCYSHPGLVYYHRRREGEDVVVRLWAEKHTVVFLLQCARIVRDDSVDHIESEVGTTSYGLWEPWVPLGRR